MVQNLPFVSVIIVNHNGIDFIDGCLRSVLSSNYPSFEVVFADNASSDGSLMYVKAVFGHDSRLKIIENSCSCGPAVGRNRGAKFARGKYLIFIDNDTKVDPDWINGFVKILEKDISIGSAQAKLLKMDTDKLYDCAGDFLGSLGFLIERSRGVKDNGQFDYIADILSAKSAASVIRKDLFDTIGGFDEDFYMYLEETDLSWRVWLAGYRVVFVPNAVVYHAFDTPRKNFKRYYPKHIVRYYGCRNYISTLIKNLEIVNLIRILPFHIGCWLALSVMFAAKGAWDDALYVINGVGWNILHFGVLFRKRRLINNHIRVVNDSSILSMVMDKKGLNYYLGKASAYITGKPF